MASVIEKLLASKDLEPDSYDASYQLVRETVKSLSTVASADLNIEDLDMLFLMTVGTWKSTIKNKEKNINKSSLSFNEKERLKKLLDKLCQDSKNHLYENSNGDEGSIGMFGTGFFTFRGKTSIADAIKFIKLCIDIINIDDENIILNKTHEVLKNDIRGMGIASVSQILHCLKPFVFPIINGSGDAGLKVYNALGVDLIKPKELPYYIENVKKIKKFRDESLLMIKNYRVFDIALWDNDVEVNDSSTAYNTNKCWLFNINLNNKNIWEYCKKNNCFAMHYVHGDENESSITRNINVAKKVKIGDKAVAYTGNKSIVAIGKVNREYYIENDESKFIPEFDGWVQRIGVDWEYIVDEPLVLSNFISNLGLLEPNKLSSQTINEISNAGYSKAENIIKEAIGTGDNNNFDVANYWWLNAKPSIWSFDNIDVGETIEYTSYTSEGTKRRIFKYFDEAKNGDIVFGYDTTPTKSIVAICKVVREHDGKTIKFEKVRKLENPISWDTIKDTNELSEMESIQNPIGSFFKVKPNEYEIIMEIIDNKKQENKVSTSAYNKQKLLSEVFISKEKYEDIIFDLEHKKNIILQGPPGVGKTFVAKRLAYSHMGLKDDSKIQMIQFHQNYSYEDFIQGFRPTVDGKFKLKNGVFYEFCKKAQRDQINKYYFIIDEINRGNLSKIFGELMMLIEHDKRGKEFEISLTYSQEEDDKFYIPDNLYLIGTMNTADRSLALVDYALRRRFRFININPAFSTDSFKKHMITNGLELNLLNKIVSRMEQLNDKISSDTKNLGNGYRIGHSYFCNTPNSGESQDVWYKRIVNSEIKPLLCEYWFDDEETAEMEVNNLLYGI